MPYNPQQNGVVESKNWSIIETIEVVTHDMDLPMFLRAKACNTIVYYMNICPYRVWKDETLEDALIVEKLWLSLFHVFGCLAYTHVPNEKRTKLEPLSMKGVFVCYNNMSKAF